MLSFRLRKGTVQQTLDIAPGAHEVRVQVSWDGPATDGAAHGQFKAGATRRLDVTVDRLTRDLIAGVALTVRGVRRPYSLS